MSGAIAQLGNRYVLTLRRSSPYTRGHEAFVSARLLVARRLAGLDQ
jgi:hypothetical protein